jgi:hyperosmotically inducible protein
MSHKLSTIFWTTVVAAIVAWAAVTSVAQEGVGQKIGRSVDQGVHAIGSTVEEGWQQVKEKANRMGLSGRVYARLHWDKTLQSATLDIDVHDGGVVTLKGSVADDEAKHAAERLASNTVGVTKVVSELAVAPPATTSR